MLGLHLMNEWYTSRVTWPLLFFIFSFFFISLKSVCNSFEEAGLWFKYGTEFKTKTDAFPASRKHLHM